MYTRAETLDGTHLGSVRHGEYEPFLPAEEADDEETDGEADDGAADGANDETPRGRSSRRPEHGSRVGAAVRARDDRRERAVATGFCWRRPYGRPMSDTLPDRAVRAFEAHEAFERDGDGFAVTTTTFDGRVTAEPTDEAPYYTLTVRAPTLQAATADEVGEALVEGWFDTYELRLEDAPTAVRGDLKLDEQRVVAEGDEAVAVFGFEQESADRAPDVVKAVAEYVEGTYMEGIVPGYDYVPPVSKMLSQARQSGGDGGGGGPMPL